MNNRKPVFTYILTWLNPIIPPTVIYLLGISLVLGQSSTRTVRWLDLHFQAVLTGWFICLACSLGYYILVSSECVRPGWKKNLILVVVGYATIPIASMIPERTTENPPHVVLEFWWLSILLFTLATIYAKRIGRKSHESARSRSPYFASPLWIAAFAAIHYVSFFASSLCISVFLRMKIYLPAWLLHKINILLRQPLYNSLTEDFVARYLPGPRAHLVFLMNAIIWAFAAWLIIRALNRNNSDRMIQNEDVAPNQSTLPDRNQMT